jgi:hypothetical protein
MEELSAVNEHDWRPKYLSVTAVDSYLRCPAAYRRRYIDGIKDAPTGPMAFGRVFAKALEAIHRGLDGDLVFVQEYAAALRELQAAGTSMTTPARHDLAILDRYRLRGVLEGTPEARFELFLPDRRAVPVPILGFMDLLAEKDLAEFKTSATRWTQARVDASMQGHLYGLAFHRLRGRRPDCVRFLILSTRYVGLQELEMQPTTDGVRLFEAQAAAVWRGIVAGDFSPRCGRCQACRELRDRD